MCDDQTPLDLLIRLRKTIQLYNSLEAMPFWQARLDKDW